MNGDIKNLFKFVGLLMAIGLAGLLMFIFFTFLIAGFYNDFTTTEFPYFSFKIVLIILFIFTAITYYPLRFLPTENLKDGIWDITLFLVYFPVIVSLFLSGIIIAFMRVSSDSSMSLVLAVTFFGPYIASYKKMMGIVHSNKLRKPKTL